MKRLSKASRILVLRCFTEGVGVNATARMAGVSKNTVLKLLADLAPVCREYQRRTLVNLHCKKIQCDELWAFCGMKQKNVPAEPYGARGFGDVWTWVGLCAECRIVPSWLVAPRDGEAADVFMADLASRLANRVQLTTDGHKPYLEAVESAFGSEVDFAQLVKYYASPGGPNTNERKYSPGAFCSTSYSERLNLEPRTRNRQFTRLTNGFSRKVQNLRHSLDIGFMVHNFVKPHGTLRVSPAMEANVTDQLWSYEDVVALLEAVEPSAATVSEKRHDRRRTQ